MLARCSPHERNNSSTTHYHCGNSSFLKVPLRGKQLKTLSNTLVQYCRHAEETGTVKTERSCVFTWCTAWAGCFFYSILGALSCVLQLCVLERCTYSHTRPLLRCLSYISTSGPSSGPQLSTWSAATTTPILAKLFDLSMTEAVTYMHTGHRCRLHQLTLEGFLQELPQLTVHPDFLHLPEAQCFRWSVSAERRPRWWTRCSLTHAATLSEPERLSSHQLLCSEVRWSVFLCSRAARCVQAAGTVGLHQGGSVCLCVWGGDCSKFQMACPLATCGINKYNTNAIILKLCV